MPTSFWVFFPKVLSNIIYYFAVENDVDFLINIEDNYFSSSSC